MVVIFVNLLQIVTALFLHGVPFSGTMRGRKENGP